MATITNEVLRKITEAVQGVLGVDSGVVLVFETADGHAGSLTNMTCDGCVVSLLTERAVAIALTMTLESGVPHTKH